MPYDNAIHDYILLPNYKSEQYDIRDSISDKKYN